MPTELLIDIKPWTVFFHALSASLGIGATLTGDYLLMSFLRDNKVSRLESSIFKTISTLFPYILIIIIVTGMMLFGTNPDKYLHSSKFMTKMIAVTVILFNGYFLHKFVAPRLTKLDFTHHRHELIKRLAFASGSVSFASWTLSYLLGSLSKIPFSVGTGITLYFLGLILAICGSQLMYERFNQKNLS